MARKKIIIWSLAALIAIGGGIAIWRHQHRKAPATAAEHSKKPKHVAKPDDDAEDKAPPPPPKPRVTDLSPAGKALLAEKAFITGLRAILNWRSIQAPGEETNRQFLDKLTALSCEDLPEERRNAWQSVLQAWKAPTDLQRKQESQRAAEVLNAMFKAHGENDLAL